MAEHLRAARSQSSKTRFAEALGKVNPADVNWSILHEIYFSEGRESELEATKESAELEIAAMEYYGTVQEELGFNAHYHSDRRIRINGQTAEGAQSLRKASCAEYYLAKKHDPEERVRRYENNRNYRRRNKQKIAALSRRWHLENYHRESLRTKIRLRLTKPDVTCYEKFLLDVIYDLFVRKTPKFFKLSTNSGGQSFDDILGF